MRRLLAVAAIAASFAAPMTAHASFYTRPCGGAVDTRCRGTVCPTDCWTNDCLVWLNPLHDSMLAVCRGPIVVS